AQHALDGPAHRGIVLHDEEAHDSGAAKARVSETSVPSPGALLMSRVPPYCQARARQIASPRPVPLGLVEKKGSPTRPRCSGRRPGPSSRTRTTAPRPRSGWVEIVTAPPRCANASIEFVTRFQSTRSRWSREKRTGGRP